MFVYDMGHDPYILIDNTLASHNYNQLARKLTCFLQSLSLNFEFLTFASRQFFRFNS